MAAKIAIIFKKYYACIIKKVEIFRSPPPGYEGYFSIFVGVSNGRKNLRLKHIHEDHTIQRSDSRSHV
jgi:hypothetical protein